MRIGPLLLLGLGLCPTVYASDLQLSVESGGRNAIVVTPGESVDYAVVGVLSDANSLGLGMVAFDLSFSGGPLAQANTPTAMPMQNFAAPLGLTNPAGFGGTVTGGSLVQVGGAQNTINNTFAPLPLGTVLTGIALPGSPQVLATGNLTAPLQVGTYVLSVDNLMANVIRLGADGDPHWPVDAAGVGTKTNLVIKVEALFAEVEQISIANPGTQVLELRAGPAYANRTYFVLGTFTGSAPGITLANGTKIPLNPSAYLNFTVSNPNTPLLSNSLGVLDGAGEATAAFTLPHVPASAAGLVIHHAYVLLQPINFASNAVEVTLVP